MILSIVFLCIQACIALFFLYMVIAFVAGAPFVPSTKPTANSMIALAGIKSGSTVYDLGSGNGKLLVMAAQKGAKAKGYEINPFLVLLSNILHPQTHTYWKNFWNADVHDADVVFIYLLPWKMDRLAEKLKRECKKGTVIVSNSFIFPKWKILRQDPVNHVYVFRV